MRRLRNVTVLTRDLDAALASWEKASGLKGYLLPLPESASFQGERASLEVGGISIDLLSPARVGQLQDALEERAEGLYCLIIETDAFLETVNDLRGKGVGVSEIGLAPDGLPGVLLDPASTHGVPIRLVESHPKPAEGSRPEPAEGKQ